MLKSCLFKSQILKLYIKCMKGFFVSHITINRKKNISNFFFIKLDIDNNRKCRFRYYKKALNKYVSSNVWKNLIHIIMIFTETQKEKNDKFIKDFSFF